MSAADYPPFMADGLCAQTDPELFFPTVGGTPAPAIAVCNLCPVKAECRVYALGLPDGTSGVWGGLAPTEPAKDAPGTPEGCGGMSAIDNQARAEDVRFMAATGENLTGAARRLGISREGVEKWCVLHGMRAELNTLRGREPGDPTRMALARDRAAARGAS